MDFFLFLDFETSGDPDLKILEVAWMLTDSNLNVVTDLYSKVIYQHQGSLKLHPDVKKMHTDNGLLGDVSCSVLTIPTVEREIYCSIQPLVDEDNSRVTLTGFSCHYDRALIKRDMPQIDTRLHYRHFDISVLRSAYHYWVENIPSKKHEHNHRARGDVIAAWDIARAYKELFKKHLPQGLIAQGVML